MISLTDYNVIAHQTWRDRKHLWDVAPIRGHVCVFLRSNEETQHGKAAVGCTFFVLNRKDVYRQSRGVVIASSFLSSGKHKY